MNIVIIGSGNIATHLAVALYQTNNVILQIYSRTLANASALANVVHADATNKLSAVNKDADLYIIAVSDTAIPQIVQQLPPTLNGIVVHTSGSTDLKELQIFKHIGVIYPPQSINKNIHTDLAVIPFGIEGNTQYVYNKIFELIHKIAPHSFPCSTQQRLALHISAVIANNFSNALFILAKEIMDKENLDFDLLKPIILETALKIQNHNPLELQTGPARRGDKSIVNKHLEFLSQSTEDSKIYQILTDFIVKRYHK